MLDVHFPLYTMAWTQDEFTASFSEEAVRMICQISQRLIQHQAFVTAIFEIEPLALNELVCPSERKLAGYILSRIEKRPQEVEGTYIVSELDVVYECNALLREVIITGLETFPPEDTISHMLDAYPLDILSQACATNMFNSHIMGEAVRRYIDCPSLTDDAILLVLNDLSPLSSCRITPYELTAVQCYLHSSKYRYVRLLLHCLYEFGRHENIINTHGYLTYEELIETYDSAWLTLFFFAVHRNILEERNEEILPSVDVNDSFYP